MKIVVAPDKFKGSLTAREVCEATQRGILESQPDARVEMLPLADGGEGSLAILIDSLGLDTVEVTVQDPLFRSTQAIYGRSGDVAYIEMAQSSGLQLLQPSERTAANTSSVGVGKLMRHALHAGVKKIYLFVGGSATNDGGMGMAHGLGFRFLDEKGHSLQPIGRNFENVARIKPPNGSLDFQLTIVTDVQNVLLGPEGATRQYGPQKGATKEEIRRLEAGMKHFAGIISSRWGRDVSRIPGSGAAGGIGVSAMGLLSGKIQGGIDTILNQTNFDDLLTDANLVITGEGKLDEQTLQGKVVDGVCKRCRTAKVPVVVICGDSSLSRDEWQQLQVLEVLKVKSDEHSVAYSMTHAASLVQQRIAEYMTMRPLEQ